jgi:hypothetical protein
MVLARQGEARTLCPLRLHHAPLNHRTNDAADFNSVKYAMRCDILRTTSFGIHVPALHENGCIRRLKSQRFCVGKCALGVVTCMRRIDAGIDHNSIAALRPDLFRLAAIRPSTSVATHHPGTAKPAVIASPLQLGG